MFKNGFCRYENLLFLCFLDLMDNYTVRHKKHTKNFYHNRCCFCKVVWQRYLGEVGKFYRTLWLIYPRHCISKSVKYSRSYDKKNFGAFFYASQCSLLLCPTL